MSRTRIGKSKNILDTCDLSILLLNNNEELTEEDLNLMRIVKKKKHIIIINKIDLENKLDVSKIDEKYLTISVVQDKGIDELKEIIIELFNLGEIETEDLTYLSNARSIALLKQALNKINECIDNIDIYPIDVIEIDLKESWNLLG